MAGLRSSEPPAFVCPGDRPCIPRDAGNSERGTTASTFAGSRAPHSPQEGTAMTSSRRATRVTDLTAMLNSLDIAQTTSAVTLAARLGERPQRTASSTRDLALHDGLSERVA